VLGKRASFPDPREIIGGWELVGDERGGEVTRLGKERDVYVYLFLGRGTFRYVYVLLTRGGRQRVRMRGDTR
jgi:hypothetical protein